MIGLLSYPKSGSTLVRYLFEYITNQSTIHLLREKYRSVSALTGTNYVNKKLPPVLIKKHYVDKEIKTCSTLILLVRDFIEVIPSYQYSRLKNKRKNLTYKKFAKEFKPENMYKQMREYCKNIRLYMKWNTKYYNNKMIIDYSTLINNPINIIRQIHKIVGGRHETNCINLSRDYEIHKNKVLNFKRSKSGLKLNTSGNQTFFRNLMSEKQINELNFLYGQCCNKLGIEL